ncbi:hypothetical protein GF340_06060 [Candidatus Peregrinibacteria bacterium]|nr:hypothetical protein [Candidatus Peregrinibacteria bacterium]
MFKIKNKKAIFKTALLIGSIVAIWLLMYNFAFAQDAGIQPLLQSDSINNLYTKMTEFLNAIAEFLQRLLWPVLLMIGSLLKNDILFSAGMEETMLEIWVNIRNIVNILFVIVLLGIAFYNVVGGQAQDYHIKTILPKFIIALIAVNFSFTALKVVIDGVNVVTTAIFALPGAVARELPSDNPTFATKVCQAMYGTGQTFLDNTGQNDIGDPEEQERRQANTYCTDTSTTSQEGGEETKTASISFTEKGKQYFSNFDAHNAGIVLAINVAEVADLDKVAKASTDVKKFAVNTLFTVVLFIVYAVAFIALLIILFVRLVVLWLAMVLSPIIALSFVLPESLKSALGGGDFSQQIVKNIIVPIPIAIVMSIGFIMLDALKSAKFTDVAINTSTSQVNLLTSGLSTLQDVIAAVGMVVFIWVGVFKAAEGTAAGSLVSGLKNAVEGFGKFAATAPIKYAPLFPVTTPEGESQKVSLAGGMAAMNQMRNAFESRAFQEASSINSGFGIATPDQALQEMEQANDAKDASKALGKLRASGATLSDRAVQEKMGKMLMKGPIFNEFNREYGGSFRTQTGKNLGEFRTQLQRGEAKQEDIQAFLNLLNQRDSNFRQGASEQAQQNAQQAQGTAAARGREEEAPSRPTAQPVIYTAPGVVGAAGAYSAVTDSQREAVFGNDRAKELKGVQAKVESGQDAEKKAAYEQNEDAYNTMQAIRQSRLSFQTNINKAKDPNARAAVMRERIAMYKGIVQQQQPDLNGNALEKAVEQAMAPDVPANNRDEFRKVITNEFDKIEAKAPQLAGGVQAAPVNITGNAPRPQNQGGNPAVGVQNEKPQKKVEVIDEVTIQGDANE